MIEFIWEKNHRLISIYNELGMHFELVTYGITWKVTETHKYL